MKTVRRNHRALEAAVGGLLGGLFVAGALYRNAVTHCLTGLLRPRRHGEREIEQVLAIEAARVKALVSADVATLDRITAEGYVHVESNGRQRSKAEFLDGLARSEYRFESFVIDENKIQIVGRVAIVTGRYHNDIRTRDGLQPTKCARHIRIYVKQGHLWQNIAHQATQLQMYPP